MICRLCLIGSKNILQIYNEAGEMAQKEVLKIVAKYFQIEIGYEDTISNIICMLCWDQLHEFHKFWLSIEEKQKNLESHLQLPGIKRDIEEVEAESIAYNEMPENNENIDTGLYEPEIDMFFGETGKDANQTECAAEKIEEESMVNDQFMVPLTHSVDSNSNDIKYKMQKLCDMVKRQGTRKRGRPKKSDIATKKNQTGIKENPKRIIGVGKEKNTKRNVIAGKPEISENYEEKLKATLKADEFLAEHIELSCCICTERLKDFKDLKMHFRQKHECAGYVVCCDQRFLKRTLFVDHIQLHKNPDFFRCSICNKQLTSRKNYVNHMHTLHSAEENLQFACKLCPKKFIKQYILDGHIKMCHVPKEHVCKLCDKAFANIWTLRQHERAVHRNEFESVCEICGKRLKTAGNLKYHMESIHSTEPRPEVQCTVCHKWLKSDNILRKHMKSHRDAASGVVFKCPHCNIEKKSRSSLSSHIIYHHSNKVFTCTMCAKEFKTPTKLKEHEATHTGIDLYTCSFCPKTFRSNANMHKHKIHSHSDEWVRKYAQPNEYTLSVLNKSHNIEAQKA